MADSDEHPAPASPRATLKLKTAPRQRAAPAVAAPAPAPAPQLSHKPRYGAKTVDWADEHKQRMQADMDALGGAAAAHSPRPSSAHKPSTKPVPTSKPPITIK